MCPSIKLLADLSYLTGLIGYPEYLERCEIANWVLNDDSDDSDDSDDPRFIQGETHSNNIKSAEMDILENDTRSFNEKKSTRNASLFEIKMLNEWIFTIGDVDCYPSVPHGHSQTKTNEWPKLNPYNGRVFSSNNQENTKKRLNKQSMKMLWNDSAFVEYCREQVLWYSKSYPNYIFPKAKKGKNVFPKW